MNPASTFGARRSEFPPRCLPTFVRGPLQTPAATVWERPAGELGPTLTLRAHYDALTGYGQLACGLLQEMTRRGVPCQGQEMRPSGKPWEPAEWGKAAQLPADVTALLHPQNEEGWELLLASPLHEGTVSPCWTISMWEAGRLPQAVIATLNRKQAIIVPSEWNQVLMDSGGVTRPIYKIQLPLADCYREYTPCGFADGPFTFGMTGRRAHGGVRKGYLEACQAFLDAFPREKDVRLRYKCFADCDTSDLPQDPRIIIQRGAYSEAQMAGWYASLDCYFSMSKAEGFGLCPLAAMGVGRPVIGCAATGQAEYLSEACGYPIGYDLVPANVAAPTYSYEGYFYVPRHDEAVGRLREVFVAGRGSARAKGVEAHLKAEEFTWARFGTGLIDVLRKEGAPLR